MKAWLKGGLIALIIPVIAYVLIMIYAIAFGAELPIIFPFFLFLSNLFLNSCETAISCSGEGCFACLGVVVLEFLITFFFAGAILGLIVSKIKKK